MFGLVTMHVNNACCRIPIRAQSYYQYLHVEKHFSQMTLLAGLLAIPLTLGEILTLDCGRNCGNM